MTANRATDHGNAVGVELPKLLTGPWTSAHIVRWCAAQQNWDRIHHDADYARDVAGLPSAVINGALKQNLFVRFLQENFGQAAWPWRIDCAFLGMDLVGHRLQLEGRVSGAREQEDLCLVSVDLTIFNPDLGKVTSRATAVMMMKRDRSPVVDALSMRHVAWPSNDQDDDMSGDVPPRIASQVGCELERVTSYIPLDLSRLRLFADAIGCLKPSLHYDVDAGNASIHGCVVAPPWFPAHALSAKPGERELSIEPLAMGREAVCEVGRNLPALFDLPAQGLLSGGNRAQVHSLLRLGETVEATSRLAGVKCTRADNGQRSLVFRTCNEYATTGGRPLLSESATVICRMHDVTH